MDSWREYDEMYYEKRKKIIILTGIVVVVAVEQYKKLFIRKQPYRGESLRGFIETERIISVSNRTCRSIIRMSRKTFFSLCQLMQESDFLRDSPTVRVEEQLVMFLQTIGHNLKNRKAVHDFGHSGETVSRYFNLVLGAVIKLYPILLKPLCTTTHERISSNCRSFYPYFKDCIGAIDGSHVPAWVPLDQHCRFRDRHGEISQNILAACDFNMKFTYILSGCEGSASDSRILEDALHRDGEGWILVPQGKFYLDDAGFANQKGFMRPYRNVCYHLKEWRNSNQSPTNKKELFNLRHSKLRNVIERAFRLLKSKFTILKSQVEYPYKTQTRIVLACVLIHNHILTQNSAQEEEDFIADEEAEATTNGQTTQEETNMVVDSDASDGDCDGEDFRMRTGNNSGMNWLT
ncbi:putative nuclease HARBI1 [Macadamia integrifolia]|uniref:putative nuclease HARBI1 n=1 Tax=Macadamia integrifolia TaxID=60698 RepID=UPI001C4F0C08|nr:putative nuclease HARBI1 [Macadamia integrifolia]XP_042502870.1 putative nuclease HARBI1 [Macadamia integrifolia]